MKIRKAEIGDIDEIVKTEQESFRAAWNCDSVRAEFEKEFSQIFIAENGGTAGFLVFYKIGDEAEIARIAVKSEYRRQGVARALIDYALSAFCGNVYLDVRKNNAPARALYEQAGFEQIGVRRGYYQNPQDDAILMKKTVFNTVS